MIRAKYVTIEEIVPHNFLERPSVVVAEYGNGFGKTHAAVDYAVQLQKMGVLDRIYIVEPSQKGCENVVRKIENFGGKAIWHVGLEKFCPMFDRLSLFIAMGIPAAYFCLTCPYFRGKSRMAYKVFEEMLLDEEIRIVEPMVVRRGLDKASEICIHPILRAMVLDPTFEQTRRLELDYTPIIVMPSQLLLSHQTLLRWEAFKRRQRKPRRNLLIIDEADSIFYSSLKIEMRPIEFTDEDRTLLEEFSSKTRNLTLLETFYKQLYEELSKAANASSIYSTKSLANRVRAILERADPILRSIERKRKQIIEYVLQRRIFTRVFLATTTLLELLGVKNLPYVLRTAEMLDDGTIVLYDYDHGTRVLFDTEFPWRSFWKISLSATLPTRKLGSSSFISPDTARLLYLASKTTRTYENVYVTIIEIFESIGGMVNRNAELPKVWTKIIEALKALISLYEEKFGERPGGVCIWLGNKKQLRFFAETLARAGVKLVAKQSSYLARYRGIPILLGYCGSPIARGIDLNKFDISIVVAPLLRPPRRWGFLDVIDFARGIAELIQAAMRIVRSPRPEKPKLIAIERTLTGPFYAQLYPDWFKELVKKSYLDLGI